MARWRAFPLLLTGLLLVGSLLSSPRATAQPADDDEGFSEQEKEETTQPAEQYQAPLFKAPTIVTENTYFVEYFADKDGIGRRWFTSVAKKEGAEEELAKYNGEWAIGTPSKVVIENDYGLVVKTKARHHAIASALKKPFDFAGQPLVLQYEVMYEEGQECGGGYLKLISSGSNEKLEHFTDKTPYTVMFGPDKCGTSSKMHLILRHQNPKNGTISEHHAKQPTSKSLSTYFDDKLWHLYTLVIKPDNNYKVLVDNQEIMSGNLLNDLQPAIEPPKQVADPDDKKPTHWDDREQIVDAEDKKPEDWDESQPKEVVDEDAKKPEDWLEDEESLIPDPEAKPPADWDKEMDGEWEAKKIPNAKCEGRSGCGKWNPPMKPNPLYKGKWTARKISNPAYKGKWSARLIDNPHYFEANPYNQLKSISAVGIELWTMSKDIVFDNIIITDSVEEAHRFAEQTFSVKKEHEKQYNRITNPPEGIFKQLLAAAEDRPWLWAVYVLVVLIPVILISVFLFGRKSSSGQSHPKKSDAPQPDLIEEEEEEGEERELGEEEAEGSQGSSRGSAGGNTEEESASENNNGGKESASKRVTRSSSKLSQTKSTEKSPPQNGTSEESASNSTPPSASTTRRARPRRQD